MSPETLAITYGLSSALSWGAGDFSGGLATKRGDVFTVIFYSQIIGIILLAGLSFLFPETLPNMNQIFWGALAGLMGAFGLVALYSALAGGSMGIVAPLSSVLTALVPMTWSFVWEGLPASNRLLGFAGALLAVWLLSTTSNDIKVSLRHLLLPLIAGLGFGLFFVCIDHASAKMIIWPLIIARLASLAMFGLILSVRKKKASLRKGQWIPIALAGILDTAGNAFFVLAAQSGRLDVSAVLTSLYPAATVMLAWGVLKERLNWRQWVGVGTALLALGLIAG